MKATLIRKKYSVLYDINSMFSNDLESEYFDNYQDALDEFESIESQHESLDTLVFLEEKTITYKVEIDEEEYDMDYFDLDDFTIEEIENDLKILEQEETDWETIKERVIRGYNKDAEDLLLEVRDWLMREYGWDGYNYHYITYNDVTITIRLKDHTANPARVEKNMLSIVISDHNPTAKKFMKTSNEISFTSEDDIEFIKEEIKFNIKWLVEHLEDEY